MKLLYLIIWSLVFSISSQAQVIINKIDFSKSESITEIIKGVNKIRGSQNVVLQLDESKNIKFVDASSYSHMEPLSIYIKSKDGMYFNRDEEIMGREQFLKPAFSKSTKFDKFPVVLIFHDSISGSEGQQVLRDLSNNDFEIIMHREETIKERDL